MRANATKAWTISPGPRLPIQIDAKQIAVSCNNSQPIKISRPAVSAIKTFEIAARISASAHATIREMEI